MRKIIICCFIIAFCSGCSVRTVYVPDGSAVRLRAPIRRAPVWIRTDKGEIIASRMDIPVGWYCLPDSDK